jgi:tRNA(Ile)-lysidine synthase
MSDRVLKLSMQTISRFGMIEYGDSILISVSGGPDSVFLTHLLYKLKDRLGLKLYGFSLDHKTREGQSGRDLEFVKNLYRKMGIELFCEKVDAAEWSRTRGFSFQEGARNIRLHYLNDIAEKYDIKKIAVGHNMDDNMETFLMRLIRGSGAKGLSGIKPFGGRIIRPLINTSGEEIKDYLKEKGIAYCLDRSNLENRYLRNRIRNILIPYIEKNFYKNFKSSLNRSIEILREEENFLSKYSMNVLEEIAYFTRSRDRKSIVYLKIPVEPLLSNSVAIRRRVIICAVEKIKGTSQDISFRNIKDALKLAVSRSGENKWITPLKNLMIFRIDGFMHMANTNFMEDMPDTIKSYIIDRIKSGINRSNEGKSRTEIIIDGQTELKDFGMTVRAKVLDSASDFKSSTCSKVFLDYDKIIPPLRARSWIKGDRFYPLGAGGSKKLHDFFIDKKIPINKREKIPVFCDSEKIIWIGKMRIDSRVKITPETSKFLYIELFEK